MAHFHNNALIGASGQGGYQIERSLRFNSADSAYLNRTPASAGNRKTWTWSGWVKRGKLGGTFGLLEGNAGVSDLTAINTSSDTLSVQDYSAGVPYNLLWTTTAVYRDPSAWYHIVVAYDTTQASSSNTVKIYINGTAQVVTFTAVQGSYSQNRDSYINTTVAQRIGVYNGLANYFNGYLTEIHFIDGQALTPSSFGETDTITGVWKPKKYIHTTSSATSWDYRAYSGTGSPGSWSSMTSVSSGNALGANSSSGTSNPSVAIYSAGAKSKIFRFTGGSGDSRTINVWSSDDGVTWTSQASTTFSVLGSSGHQTTGQYAVYQFANGDFFSSSSYAVTVNDINSFYLKFADNSGTTSTTLGKDSSGNGNNWTPNNFSVTAGAGNDSLIDTPTPYADGGNGRGNYPTWNPLDRTAATYSNGNLDVTSTSAASPYNMASTMRFPATGKWYAEVTLTGLGAGSPGIGIGKNNSDAYAIYRITGAYLTSGMGASTSGTPNTYTTNDVIGIAYDAGAGTLEFYKNGVDQAGNITGITASTEWAIVFRADSASGDAATLNTGQRAFAYTPPSGFKALNTQNLPEPTIKKPSSYFNAVTYTGSASSVSVTGVGFQPDFIWTKARSTTFSHGLMDAVRGVGSGATKILFTNNTNAEATQSNILSIDSDGFTTGTSSVGETNNPGTTYVAWCWDESATPGFDIVTYTGNGTNNRAINHGLGVTPAFIVVKDRTNTFNWDIYHQSLGINATLTFTTDATRNLSAFGTSAPTSTQFFTQNNYTNTNAANLVAYLWSEVAGFSKFGSYSGTGSSDGPFVFLGFRPKFVMFKRSDSTGSWFLEDSARGTYNVMGPELYANLSDAESTVNRLDFLSNGFKLRAANPGDNASGGTYIYAAFAETPFRYSLAR